MSEVDVLKEKIAYLKLWLGIMVVADIGLVGWLLGNYIVANWALINAAIAAIFVISFGTFVLHKRIEKEFSGLRTFDMHIVVGLIVIAGALLFVYAALDATKHPK
jgi:hypothetical protein